MPFTLPRLALLLLLSSLLLAPQVLANGDPDDHPYYNDDDHSNSASNGQQPDSSGNGARQTASEETENQPEETRSSAAAVDLGPMEATYQARMTRGVSLRGEATRSLKQREDGRWDYRFDVDSFIADVRESAILSYEDNRVTPHEYRYSLRGRFIRNRATSYDFDWDSMTVRNNERDREHSIADYPQIQDQLTAQLQLWVDLKAGKTQMEYLVADNGDVDDYQFEVLGEETIDTENFGKVDTIKVWRVRDEDSPRSTIMWFAPEWDYLLVKLEQREDGGEDFDIFLKKADIAGQRIRP
ncbi:MAG: DUF3108 domain-containing protein [Halomonadaceae bacterium]|nr:MAG: DUF3108 domain-containing protein [Halomonadaceae bacterium]